jgi:hypothetical protein
LAARLRAVSAALTVLVAATALAYGVDVELVRRPDRAYEVDGRFLVDASTAVVWDVLTDYEDIPSFVKSMRSSRIRETHADGSVLLEQIAVGDMFFLTKTMRVLLEVRRGSQSLKFTDVGRDDFWIYDGSWNARRADGGGGVQVEYHLLVQPDFMAPSFFVRRAMRKGVSQLLEQVQAEMVRRNAGS